ncbi:MAG: N(4)-(beta-N-acetylglucosaminyl)-L-asparaginase [Bacteroidetes bacterium]|nr:N(4)-(beta-N-acetylglucosaminyl)-L-asparaginase [Bacteroidota bacterium]
MLTRKDFLKRTSFTALGSLFLPVIACNNNSKEKKVVPLAKGSASPLVIATWKNLKATEAAMHVIKNNGSALDAVEAGAKVPEADPEDMSVGYGGRPDRDGFVTLDACIMDENGNTGSVTFLQHIIHPISVARLVMEKTPHVMLSGDGALQFALGNGFNTENLLTDKAKAEWEEWVKENKYTPVVNEHNHDTIGILAIDNKQNISGACSTSGWAYKMHGRVGDSPIPGAGMYVDNEVGGACATGTGELVVKICGSFLVVELMRKGATPQEAVEEAVHRIVKKNHIKDEQVGFLAVNKNGEHGAYALRENFSYTYYTDKGNSVFDASFELKKV